MENLVFEIYKNSIMPHGKHKFNIESYMDMATMCAYPSSTYELPHCKFVLWYCAQFPCIDIPSPESYQNNSKIMALVGGGGVGKGIDED